MSWVRLDDGFMEHPKVLALTPKDFQVHMRALCYASRRRGPHIPSSALLILATTKQTAERLTEVGLWDVNGDGWVIHDWDDYQPASSAERQKRYREKKRGGDTD